MHRHRREDEYSYILEGSVGALLGDNVVIGKQGDLIFKPRNQWHTFWNAGETPARVFIAKTNPENLAQLCARYQLETDPASIPNLVQRFGLRFPGEPI